jgi:hypothetical protein
MDGIYLIKFGRSAESHGELMWRNPLKGTLEG